MKKIAAIHFGAGNIGRGLIVKIYQENNIVPILIDNNIKLVKYLERAKSYKIFYDDDTNEEIKDFILINSIKKIKELINNYDVRIVSTSIGTKNFNYVKTPIKKIFNILKNKKLDIIAFENDFLSSNILKKTLNDNDSNHNYINSMVDRIVPYSSQINEYDLFTEKYFEVILDKNNKKNNLLKKEIIWTNNFEPYLYRKFWIINSTHLMLGYLFNEKNFLYELNDNNYIRKKELEKLLKNWFLNIKKILVKEFKFDEKEINEYIEKNTKRLFNNKINDEIKRLRRNPIKKLKPNERIFSLRSKFVKHNIKTKIIDYLIFKILTFNDKNDIEQKEINDFLLQSNLKKTFLQYTNLKENEIEKIIDDFLHKKLKI